MRLLVTTVVRHAPLGQPSGYVYVFDMVERCVLARWPIDETPFRRFDPNPRGGLRGARGVAVCGERLAIAITDRVDIFDREGRRVGRITHPLMGGVHDLCAEEDGLWVTCTHADLLVKMSWSGELLDVWDCRSQPGLAAQLGLPELPRADLTVDYRDPRCLRGRVCNLVHLNGVSRGRDGLLLSFGRILSTACLRKLRLDAGVSRLTGAEHSLCHHLARVGLMRPRYEGCRSALIERPDVGPPRVLRCVEGATEPNHNVARAGKHVVYCETNTHSLVTFTPEGTAPERRVRIPGRQPFVRGLCVLDSDRVFVGSQAPAAVYEVDLKSARIVSSYPLAGEEAVYAICVLPEQFCVAHRTHGTRGRPRLQRVAAEVSG